MEDLMPLPVNDLSFMFICRFCECFAEAKDAGSASCGKACGGPKKRMDYPKYRGPLTTKYIADHCFVCGEETRISVHVHKEDRALGVCEKHLIFAGIGYDDIKKVKAENMGIMCPKMVPISPEELFGLKGPEDKS